ncbi:MAG TPA: acyl carrier protein [Candidatus Babeliales bacterium]|jgi:acyl carrier protein|nr:acyl carrier protein [Candidatus Babeliales bacterium]
MTIEIRETADKINAIIAEKLHIDAANINPQATLLDLGADSLDMVDIVMKVEEEFGIEINDEDAEKLHTVQDFISYVHNLRMK